MVVNAFGSEVYTEMVRRALTPENVIAWHAKELKTPDYVWESFPTMVVWIREGVPAGEIWFEKDGVVIGKITGLAVE